MSVIYRRSQTGAISESTISNACDAIRNCHRCQTAAIIESKISNACDTIRNLDRGQTGAIRESRTCDCFNTIRNSICSGIGSRYIRKYMSIIDRRFQTSATPESLIPNACNTIRNGYRGQLTASEESPISNACDATRNSN